MKRGKQPRYITIPHERVKPEWVDGVSTEELFAANGINLGSLGTAAVSYSLDRIREDLDQPKVLLVDFGDRAIASVRACRDAGLEATVTYTEDMATSTYVKLAPSGVCVGTSFSENVFCNSYAVLKAAEECQARAVLLADPALAEDEAFLGMARKRSLMVFTALDANIPQVGWVIREAKQEIVDEESWRKCPDCGLLFDEQGLMLNHAVCPACGSYFRMSSTERINDLLDAGSFIEWWPTLPLNDPLNFPGYPEKIVQAQEATELNEAVRCGVGSIAGIRTALCVMDSQFFMGSMGSIVGEKITRTVEKATAEKLPLVIFTASGGARMQEGLISLMQMAKISSAIAQHAQTRQPYVAVLTDPTTGGVTASFAMQGDLIFAEPHALIGFAGQRVIRDTIKRELPEGFQTAEFALEHGLIDAIVERADLRSRIAHVLAIHAASTDEQCLADGEAISYAAIEDNLQRERATYATSRYDKLPQIRKVILKVSRKIKSSSLSVSPSSKERVKRKSHENTKFGVDLFHGRHDADEGGSLVDSESSSSLSVVSSETTNLAWESVQIARNTHRPTARHYIDSIVDGFIELHGDRSFADDGAIICGIGWIGTRPVTIVAQEKGIDLKERLARNFGCPQPEGYRKSLRIMKQAEKFGRPVVCIVDTQGAFCGTDAEERGQGNAIAENLLALSTLEVPVVSVIIGEGGSGGALALALADRVAMQQYAVYSVLSPEGFASILWKDNTRAAEAAAVMKMSAVEACELGVADEVLIEGEGPAHENPDVAAAYVRGYLTKTLDELSSCSVQELIETRYKRFRKF